MCGFQIFQHREIIIFAASKVIFFSLALNFIFKCKQKRNNCIFGVKVSLFPIKGPWSNFVVLTFFNQHLLQYFHICFYTQGKLIAGIRVVASNFFILMPELEAITGLI